MPRRCPGARLLLPLLLAGLGLAAGPVRAQTAAVRGFVTDRSDGQALQGVHVALQDEAGRLFGAIADADGVFVITRLQPGRYALSASFIGFRTVRDTLALAPGEVRTLNLALAPDEEALDEIVVESEREGGAAQVTAGMQSVRPRDIEMIPTPDLSADLAAYLTAMPGVVTLGDRGGQLFIRGGEPSHTLTLLDGMSVYQPFHILGFYSAFPADVLHGADVYAGGFGSRFSGRLSSVIDVQTRNGNKRRFGGATSGAPFVSTALVEGPLVRDRVSFLASARVSTIEQLAARYVDAPLPYRFGDFFGKAHAVLHDNHQLSVSALHTYDRGTLDEDAEGPGAEQIRWANTAYGFRYLILPKVVPVLGELLFSVSRLKTTLGPEAEPTRSSSIRSFNAEVNLTQFAGRSQIGWGFFLRAPTLSSELGGLYQNLSASFDRSTYAGVYVEPDVYLTRSLRVRPGVVGQLIGNKGFFVEPRLRVVWERLNHQVSAAAGLYRQDVIGLNDRRDATNIFTAWTDTPLGNASRAAHVVAGYRIAPAAGVELSVEGFYKRMTSLYIGEWTAAPRFTTRLQEASGQALGADLRLEVRHARFYAFLNYGLASVRYAAMQESLRLWFGEASVRFRPPHDRRHQVNVLLSTTLKGFDLSLRWNFGSGLPYTRVRGFDGFLLMDGPVDVSTAPVRSRVIYDRPFGGVLPTYHRLDVSAERTFHPLPYLALTLQAAVINVYDRANLFALDLFTLRRTDQLPFIPTLGVKIAFQ